MMKRTEHKEAPLDVGPLLHAIGVLDRVLKQGVLLGTSTEGELTVDDEALVQALMRVNNLLHETARLIDENSRALARTLPEGASLQ